MAKKKKKKKNPAHYVDNEDFYDALCVWKDKIIEAEECGEPRPPVCDFIGECFLKMAEGLSHRACFINYDFREEMVGDAIENCILYAHNFKKEGKNPFAYFTQMMYYAFLRRIQKEKKQLDIKTKIIERTGFDEVMVVDDTALSGSSSEYNTIKDNIVYKTNR